MKLGSKLASPLGVLESILQRLGDVERLAPGDNAHMFWQELKRKVSSRRSVYGFADSNRMEREYLEQFGSFKVLGMHPYLRQLALCAERLIKARLLGDPVLPLHTTAVLLFVAFQGKMPIRQYVMLACLLFTVHPILVGVGLIAVSFLSALSSMPRGHAIPEEGAPHVVVYGGGLRGLYTGALLAQAGQKVTVLVPESRCEGSALAHPEGAPCHFVLDRCEIGEISRYEELLSPCFHASKPVRFEPVGDAKTGWVHGVLVSSDLCQPVPLRSGPQAWVDDISNACDTDRAILRVALTQAVAVSGGLLPFIVGKLPDSVMEKVTVADRQDASVSFTKAASITTVEAASRLVSAAKLAQSTVCALRRACTVGGLMREEHTSATRASFGAWSASVTHGIHGYYVPNGGISQVCASLKATIQACSGHVFTDKAIQSIRLRNHEKDFATIETVGPNGSAQTFIANNIILAADVLECYRLVQEATVCSKIPVPAILDDVPSVQPVVRTLIAFAGTCQDLDVPQAIPIFWRKHTAISDELDGKMEWKTVTLRDGPRGVVACVVESPTKIGAMGLQDSNKDLLHIVSELFPRTRDKVIYVKSLPPTSSFSHTPARYVVGRKALRPGVDGLDGVFLALNEFGLSNSAGSIIAGYLAAHAALGCSKDTLKLMEGGRGCFGGCSAQRNLSKPK